MSKQKPSTFLAKSDELIRDLRVKGKPSMLPVVLEKLVKELFAAGMNVYRIATTLGIPASTARKYTGSSYPEASEMNQSLIDRILSDAGYSVASDALVEIESDRLSEYLAIENASIGLMKDLLTYWSTTEPGDLRVDSFKLALARECIKSTQEAREELKKQYAATQNNGELDTSNNITIEFVDSKTESNIV